MTPNSSLHIKHDIFLLNHLYLELWPRHRLLVKSNSFIFPFVSIAMEYCLYSLFPISSSEIVMQRCLFFIGRCTPSQTYTKTKAHLHFQFVVFKSCESCFVINEQPWVSNVYSKICIFYYVNIFTVCDVNRKWYCNGAEFATVTGTYQLEVRHKEVHYNSKEIFIEVLTSLTL